MKPAWRRYLHIIVDRDNLYGTTLARAIRDNQGTVIAVEGMACSFVHFLDIEIETLDENTAKERKRSSLAYIALIEGLALTPKSLEVI